MFDLESGRRGLYSAFLLNIISFFLRPPNFTSDRRPRRIQSLYNTIFHLYFVHRLQ